MNYDSVAASLWRLIKHRWYLFVLAAILGAVGAGLLASSSTYTVEQSIQIGSLDDIGAVLDASGVPDVEVQRLAQRAQLDADSSELPPSVQATYTSNAAARTVTVTVSGPSETAVNEALLQLNDRFTTITNDPLLAQIDAGIALTDETLEGLQAAADEGLEQIQQADGDPTTLAVLVGEQSSLRSEITDNAERRGALVGLRTYVDESLIGFGSSAVNEPATGKAVYAAGAIGGLALALLAGVAAVLLDRRVRRAIHLERAVPGVPVLGVVSEADPVVAAAIHAFAADADIAGIIAFGIGRGVDAARFCTAIGDAGGRPLTAAADAGAALAAGGTTSAYIGVVGWGAANEDQVSAAVGDLNRAGAPLIGLVLVGVPAKDRDWAASTASWTEPAPI